MLVPCSESCGCSKRCTGLCSQYCLPLRQGSVADSGTVQLGGTWCEQHSCVLEYVWATAQRRHRRGGWGCWFLGQSSLRSVSGMFLPMVGTLEFVSVERKRDSVQTQVFVYNACADHKEDWAANLFH